MPAKPRPAVPRGEKLTPRPVWVHVTRFPKFFLGLAKDPLMIIFEQNLCVLEPFKNRLGLIGRNTKGVQLLNHRVLSFYTFSAAANMRSAICTSVSLWVPSSLTVPSSSLSKQTCYREAIAAATLFRLPLSRAYSTRARRPRQRSIGAVRD